MCFTSRTRGLNFKNQVKGKRRPATTNNQQHNLKKMLGVKYLTEAHLKGFDRYKYNSIDTSYLSVYIMHPFWNKCVQYFPRWLAPNLITFSGFLLTVVTFLLIAYYDWDFKAANNSNSVVPRWVWLVAAINIFLAYTLVTVICGIPQGMHLWPMLFFSNDKFCLTYLILRTMVVFSLIIFNSVDGIDGKQARRTGTSGPLGELFDHGLDSYSSVLIPIYMFSLLGTNDLPPKRMFFCIWNIFLNFYLSHVEKYSTGVMFLPWGYDFTMWGVTLLLMFTFIVGPTFWQTTHVLGLSTANIFEISLPISAMITSHPIIIKNIYLSYKNETGKMRPIWEAARPLFAFLWLFIITMIWVFNSVNNIINLEPRIMFVLFGTLFSNIACRLIVAQMSDTRCDAFNILMWPLAVVVMISCFPFYHKFGVELSADVERWILHGLTIFSTIAHIHYGQGVVREMCHHFRIKCFKVPKSTPPPSLEIA